MNTDIAFNEYAQAVADTIENCVVLPTERSAVIQAAARFLESNDWVGQHARLFWQMVAGILLWRRPAHDSHLREALQEAAEEVLEQAAIYGTIL